MAKVKMNLFTRFRRTRIYDPKMNKTLPKRLNWEQIEKRPIREGKKVVKGTTKRVVVVKSPNPEVFEQAIFIVREGYTPENGTVSDNVLKEAERVADEYIKGSLGTKGILARIPPPVFAVVGAAITGIAWLFFT